MKSGSPGRVYRMGERAATTEATRRRILGVALEVFVASWYDEVTLGQIASEAGVSRQSLVNHFGTKEGLITAVLKWQAEHGPVRPDAPPDDLRRASEMLVNNYEDFGDAIIRWLALEDRIPALGRFIRNGRKQHRDWVERAFPSALAGLESRAYERRLDLLVCAADVYTWKLLRRDRELSRAETMDAVCELLEALQ